MSDEITMFIVGIILTLLVLFAFDGLWYTDTKLKASSIEIIYDNNTHYYTNAELEVESTPQGGINFRVTGQEYNGDVTKWFDVGSGGSYIMIPSNFTIRIIK